LLLVRPDGYLAIRGPLNSPDVPERYLRRLDAGVSSRSDTVKPAIQRGLR